MIYIQQTEGIRPSLINIGVKCAVFCYVPHEGRAITQEISRWLPTARVRPRVWSSGICGGQSGAGAPNTSVSPANLHSKNSPSS
jgi:hypothetical protein